MDRLAKTQLAEGLKTKFNEANAAFITEYRGMTVPMIDELRNKVRDGQGEVQVLKNRIARIAAKGTSFEGLAEKFKGPVAIAFSYKDSVAVAKAVLACINAESPLQIKVGSLDGKVLEAADIEALSKLPDREVLLQMVASVLQAPVRNFACLMAAVPRDFVNVLTAVNDQKESQ